MTRKNLLIAACFAASANSAFAQQDTLQGKPLDEVVITANKYEQKQSTTGKVLTVITKEQIEKNKGKSLSQLLNEQAGVIINGALNTPGSVQTVFMRGASSGRTLILMDGIPMSDPSMINNEYDLNLFSLDNIERLEICKGPQSTLYGSDAVAGVINIITMKKDVNTPFNITSTLSGGSFGTFKGNAQVYGKIGKLNYSTRFAKLHTNGISSAYDSTGTKGYDNDNYDGNVLNAQASYQATQNLSFKAFAMYSQYKAGIDGGVFIDDKDYTINNRSLNTGAGFQFKKDIVTLTGNYQYSDITRHYLNDSGHKPSQLFSYYEDNEYYGKSLFAELYASISLGSGFTLLQGADYRNNSFNQHYLSLSMFGPYQSVTSDTSMSQTALYASLNYADENNKLAVEAGGRLNTHSRYGSNYTYTFNPSYAITQNVRLFGSVASGFKAPTLYQISFNANLQPEKSVNFEAGVQYGKQRFSTRAVYFHRNIRNGIDYNYINFSYFNYLKQVVDGLELETIYKPTDKWSLTANYTLLSSDETTQNRVTVKDTITYDYLLRRPKHSINATIGWQPIAKLDISVSAKYISSRYDVGGYKAADILLDSYFLLGANAEYRHNDHISFFTSAQNITDKKFFDVRGFNAMPFSIMGGVTLKW